MRTRDAWAESFVDFGVGLLSGGVAPALRMSSPLLVGEVLVLWFSFTSLLLVLRAGDVPVLWFSGVVLLLVRPVVMSMSFSESGNRGCLELVRDGVAACACSSNITLGARVGGGG